MLRVVILGNSGVGKSTFARSLGHRMAAPVVHLDSLFYGPGWAPSDVAEFREKVALATEGEAWIVDGNFLSLAGDITLARADLILWLEQPRWLAMSRALWRCLDLNGRDRPDLPAGCRDAPSREMLGFIWTFDRIARPDIDSHLKAQAAGKPVVALRGDRAVSAFLSRLSPPPGREPFQQEGAALKRP